MKTEKNYSDGEKDAENTSLVCVAIQISKKKYFHSLTFKVFRLIAVKLVTATLTCVIHRVHFTMM